jgi:hypothetical protein
MNVSPSGPARGHRVSLVTTVESRIAASPHRDGKMRRMGKVRTTLTIDQDVLKWVKIRAARTGVSDSAVIEASLRRDLKLDVLDELWANATMSDSRASELAVEAQHATRPHQRGSGARSR